MSVIGRLDEQVHDVLISPVSKRRRGEEGKTPPAPEPPPPDAPPEPPKDENRPRREELPVWLL